jgi:hypothetical protein
MQQHQEVAARRSSCPGVPSRSESTEERQSDLLTWLRRRREGREEACRRREEDGTLGEETIRVRGPKGATEGRGRGTYQEEASACLEEEDRPCLQQSRHHKVLVSANHLSDTLVGRDGLTRRSTGTAKRRRRKSHWRCAHAGRSTHSGGSTHAGRRSTKPAAAHHSAHRSARETHCSRHSQPLCGTETWKARNTHSEELRLMAAGQTSRWTPSTWATRPVRVARSSPVHLRRSRTAA